MPHRAGAAAISERAPPMRAPQRPPRGCCGGTKRRGGGCASSRTGSRLDLAAHRSRAMDPVGGTVSPPAGCGSAHRIRWTEPSTVHLPTAEGCVTPQDFEHSGPPGLRHGDTSRLTAGTPRNMMQALGDRERFLCVSPPPQRTRRGAGDREIGPRSRRRHVPRPRRAVSRTSPASLPRTARGISNAFRGAEVLADAVDRWCTARSSSSPSLSRAGLLAERVPPVASLLGQQEACVIGAIRFGEQVLSAPGHQQHARNDTGSSRPPGRQGQIGGSRAHPGGRLRGRRGDRRHARSWRWWRGLRWGRPTP